MNLCVAIETLVLPPGYHVGYGIVGYFAGDIYHRDSHVFGVNGENILCVTAGQFVEPDNKQLLKGSRIATLIAKSAHLLSFDEPSELCLLYGNRQVIKETLGLWYQ
jgi:hypothetical protein